VVLETAALSEAELSAYCRRKGLYAERELRLGGRRAGGPTDRRRTPAKSRLSAMPRRDGFSSSRPRLARKDQALAETAALLVLTKKVQARLARWPGRLTSPLRSAKR
jgi:transposase